MEKNFVIKGNICQTKTAKELDLHENAFAVCVDGISKGVFDVLPEEYASLPICDYGDALIFPGMVDLHVHAPQYAFRGMCMDLELMDWLNRYTFPEEEKYEDLEYAKQIQLSALPANFPENEDYGIYAQMIAAKEVGGDFYDFYKLSNTTVAFLAADVSGKGIPAAMFMMTAKTIIKDLAERGLPVNEIFTQANQKLCENNESGMFVTAWMGILDQTTGQIQFVNAGHNPPLLKRVDGSYEYLKTRGGFVLAGMEGVRYRIGELTLNPGDRLFLYTDGVTEATNGENELYGEDRLLAFMNQNASAEATRLLPALKGNIDEFVGEAPQFDDITMLMLDYKPKEEVSV